MKIHREGFPTIIIVCILLSTINWLNIYFTPFLLLHIIIAVISVVFLFLILYFFRVPNRIVNLDDNKIIAPSDGKLVVIEKVFESEYLNEECTQLSIFMSPLNVHKQWYPVNGKVIYSKYHPGKYLVAWHPKSSTENERTTIVINAKVSNVKVLYRQIAGAVARRICNYAKEDTDVEQNQEAGFIKFGSRIDVLVPNSASIKVSLNDKIVGGETILATI